MHIFKKLIHKFGKKKVITLVMGLLVIGGGLVLFGGENGETIVTVERGVVEEEVLVVGKTKAEREANLGFETSGRVVEIAKRVGERVSQGETLVRLDQSETLANVAKARASLEEAELELATTRNTSPLSYASAYSGLSASIRDAYVQADDAVRNDVDQFFTNPRAHNTEFDPKIETSDGGVYYSGLSQTTRNSISDKRVVIEGTLSSWEIAQKTLGQGEDLSSASTLALTNLRSVRDFLDEVALAINSIESTNFTYDSTIQGYKNTISGARSKVNTAITELINAKSAFDNAPTQTLGGSYNEVLIEEARVNSLRADLSAKESLLAKTVIRSPVSGIVTELQVEIGEIVTGGGEVVSVISDQAFQIEANVSEVNIGRVLVGNPVKVAFDAFPSAEFTGRVFYIDPGETIVDGVPTYKVSVSLDGAVDPRLRSGLTANLSIVTNEREGVLKVPLYAVETTSLGDFVTLRLPNGSEERREVTLGLRGKDGSVEVVSGLEEGEEIVVKL